MAYTFVGLQLSDFVANGGRYVHAFDICMFVQCFVSQSEVSLNYSVPPPSSWGVKFLPPAPGVTDNVANASALLSPPHVLYVRALWSHVLPFPLPLTSTTLND